MNTFFKQNGRIKVLLLPAVGFFVLCLVVLATLSGQNIGSDDVHSFQSIYASSDGKVVYVCDNYTVYRSKDDGENWSTVLKQSNQAC